MADCKCEGESCATTVVHVFLFIIIVWLFAFGGLERADKWIDSKIEKAASRAGK